MSLRRQDCARCNGGDRLLESWCECVKCGKCARRPSTISTLSMIVDKHGDTARNTARDEIESHYVTNIVHAGIRSDNVYEAQLILAPEIDMSMVKITVKNKNLRVTVNRPLGAQLSRRLSSILLNDETSLNQLVKRAIKHCDNFLIPENIDGDKVRAIIDNKRRILMLTAPTIKPSRALRRRFSSNVLGC